MMQNLTKSEIRTLKSLNTPLKIQKFLDSLSFHKADSAFSPRMVLRHRTAHCLEGALLAAAAFYVNGREPLILDLEAERDTDHVIAVYRENGAWGALGVSSFAGLRHRPPVYKTLRELVMSYFHNYMNLRRERTLRTFSQPVNMKIFNKQNWLSSEEHLWFVVDHLLEIPHKKILTPKMERALTVVDERSLRAEKVAL